MAALKNNLSMIRGNTKTITVTVQDDGGLLQNYIVAMKVRETYDSDAVIELSETTDGSGSVTLTITPDMTSSLDPGDYVYDIKITAPNDGPVMTAVKESRFRIEEDVTY